MKATISRSLALAAIAATIAGLAPRAIAAEEAAPATAPAASPEPTAAPLTSGKVGGTVKVTATVEDIDVAKRIVKLKDENGEVTELAVPEKVRNLAQVKKGDQVVATYYEAIAYDVFKAGTEMPPGATAMASERAKLGEKPGAGVAEATTFTATIEAIDKPASKVTLKGPEGNKVTFKVRDPKKLDVVNVGDQVQITYTRALAIAVEPAPAK
jgi:Cu/Ag efflux protein CusF